MQIRRNTLLVIHACPARAERTTALTPVALYLHFTNREVEAQRNGPVICMRDIVVHKGRRGKFMGEGRWDQQRPGHREPMTLSKGVRPSCSRDHGGLWGRGPDLKIVSNKRSIKLNNLEIGNPGVSPVHPCV